MTVSVVRYYPVQIVGDRSDILSDRPLVVVQDDDKALGVVGDVIERLVAGPASKGGITGNNDHIFFASAPIPRNRHPQSSGKRSAGMTGPITIVFTLRPQQKTV